MSDHDTRDDVHDIVYDCAGMIPDATDRYEIRLSDGSSVRLRAATQDEDEAFRHLFYTLSDTTRYLYFCAGIPSTERWAEQFATLSHVDGPKAFVLVAEVADEVIGFARFSQDAHADPQSKAVDVGIILTDAWQGRGLGGEMLCRLAAEARRRTIHTFTAMTMWENRRILRLARRIFPQMSISYGYGACEISVAL